MRNLKGNKDTRDGQQDAANAHNMGLDGARSATPDLQTAARAADDLALAARRGMPRHPDATEALYAPDRFAPDADPHLVDAPVVAEPAVDGTRRVWLTLADVAEELAVSTRTVMRWVERGELPAVVLPGGRKRIRRDVFDQWLDSLARVTRRARG
jgi:excisionase family DNA binding protein